MPMGESPNMQKGQSGIIRAALFGLCPRCAARTLFDAPGLIAPECSTCGLELAPLARGGRLAGLVTMAIGVLLITAAVLIDESLRPPIWLQVLVWAPLTVGGVLGALRVLKTAFVYQAYEASQHRNDE